MADFTNTPRAFLLRFEELQGKMIEEVYKQYAGLPYSKEKLTVASRTLETLCKEALKKFKQSDFDKRLFYSVVACANGQAYADLESEIYNKRNEVAVQVDNQVVNLNNVRKFFAKNKKDALLRKKVFDALLRKSSLMTPILQKRFDLSRSVLKPYKIDPVDAYLESENIEFRRLVQFLNSLGNGARDKFFALANRAAQNVLGKEMAEYYDDYYVFRHTLYASLDPTFANLNAISKMNQIYTDLGFSLRKINIDLETRAGKYSSPVMFSVYIPNDIRVLSQTVSPFSDFTSYCHEMGHALHYSSIDINMPYHDRAQGAINAMEAFPHGVSETFSILFENIATNPVFLKETLGLDDKVISDIRTRKRFMDLYFVTFYVANSLFKLDFWKEKLSMEQANERYSDLTERFMKIRLPGQYWQTHHVLSQYDIYAPSYLIAAVRAYELGQYLAKRFGESWWTNPDAGVWIRKELMSPGASVDFTPYSKLDEKAYLKSLLM